MTLDPGLVLSRILPLAFLLYDCFSVLLYNIVLAVDEVGFDEVGFGEVGWGWGVDESGECDLARLVCDSILSLLGCVVGEAGGVSGLSASFNDLQLKLLISLPDYVLRSV